MIELTFWGVRGSIPTPVAENLGFGGNTACISIRSADQPVIVLDAGTGIRTLGNTLSETEPVHLFLTHFHWDHIQGIPSFAPLQNTTIYSSADPADLERILAAQMRPPYYPVPMPGNLKYRKIAEETIGDLEIRPFTLHHPNGATGYRIEYSGKVVAYITDTEHYIGKRDPTSSGSSRAPR